MMPSVKRSAAEKLGLALIAVVFAVNVYRAAVQSCTVDEATTYNEYASKSVTEIFTLPYDANNQILHTLLCRLVVRTLGVSELSLRIPSLLGGLLFLSMSYRLCRLYFGRGLLFLMVFAALALNPFLADYLSVARGYGLAAGLFLIACDQLSRHLLGPAWNPRRLTLASFALGLSITANLTFVIPAAALALVFLHLEMWELRRLRFWDAVNQLILPGTVAAAVLLLLPLIRASRGAFYFGAKTIRDSLESMTLPALVHHTTPLAGFGRWLDTQSPVLLAISAVLMLGTMVFVSRGGTETFSRRMPLLLMGATLALSSVILVGAHALAAIAYPYARTGMYLVVLFTVAAGALVLQHRATVQRSAALLAAPLLVLFAAQLTIGPYNTWVFDSGTKAIVNRIRLAMARTHAEKVHIATEPLLQPSLNFYRRRYHLNGVARVEPDSLAHPADYYILSPRNAALAGEKGLDVLYRDPVSSQILAIPHVTH